MTALNELTVLYGVTAFCLYFLITFILRARDDYKTSSFASRPTHQVLDEIEDEILSKADERAERLQKISALCATQAKDESALLDQMRKASMASDRDTGDKLKAEYKELLARGSASQLAHQAWTFSSDDRLHSQAQQMAKDIKEIFRLRRWRFLIELGFPVTFGMLAIASCIVKISLGR